MIDIQGWGHHGDQGYTTIYFDTPEERSALFGAVKKINKDTKLAELARELKESSNKR
jgi:hypothetical protein